MNVRPRRLLAGSVAALVLAAAAAAQPSSPQHGGIVFTGSSIFQFRCP